MSMHIPGFDHCTPISQHTQGSLYRAVELATRKVVCLEVFHEANSHHNVRDTERFQQRIRVASLLDHPNIWTVAYVGEHQRSLYLVRPWFDGAFLNQRLESGPVDPVLACQWVIALARALQHAHDHAVLHCDVKPSNIYLGVDGVVRLCGFDCAEVAFLPPWLEDLRHGIIMGSPGYIAPEQMTGEPRGKSPSVDVWGLGVLLYQLLTARLPFNGNTGLELMMQVIQGTPLSLEQSVPGIDPALNQRCMRCLEKEPARRFATAHEVGESLEYWLKRRTQAAPTRIPLLARVGRWVGMVK